MIKFDPIAYLFTISLLTLIATIAFFYLKSLEKPKTSRRR